MTVSNVTARTSVVGTNTVGQAIPFSFPINATSDLTILSRVTTTGVETTLAETTNYTVSISGDTGGTVTMVTAVATTAQIHVIRNTPQTQPLDLEASGKFSAEVIEEAFDRLTRQVNDNADAIRRCVRAPDTDPISLNMVLPSSIDRASEVISNDASGNIVSTTGTATTVANATNANLITKRPMVDVRFFGATADGQTNDATAVQEAATHAASTGRPLYFPAGKYILGAKITMSAGTGMAIVGDGSSSTFLDWTNSDGGFDVTYTQATVPPLVRGLTLRTTQLQGGTALKLQHSSVVNSVDGPHIYDVAIRGDDVNTDTWTVGIHLLNCYFVAIRDCALKGTNLNEPNYDGTSAIIMEDCTVTQIEDVLISHWVNGIIQSGSNAGEGVFINGGEITFITNGIVLTRAAAANIVSDMHINAAEVCIDWENTLQGTIHDCILYGQSPSSTPNWVGIRLAAVSDIHVHDNFIQSIDAKTVAGSINLRTVAKRCIINNNQFSHVVTPGAGISLGTGTTECIIYGNQGLLNVTEVVSVPQGAGHDNTVRDNWPNEEYANALGNPLTHDGDVLTYEDEILIS